MEIRTKQFAIRIIGLSVLLPNISENRVIKNQLTKSGTSIGANYREANRARSKSDFANKIKICESEASEIVIIKTHDRRIPSLFMEVPPVEQ